MHSILSGLVIHNLEDACKLSEKACHGAQAEFILCYDFLFLWHPDDSSCCISY